MIIRFLFPLLAVVGMSFRGEADQHFTRADTLRGLLTPLRTCYDVTHYNLDIRVDPGPRSIAGANTMTFRVVEPFDRMQIDLHEKMTIERLTLEGHTDPLRFTREHGAVIVSLPRRLETGTRHALRVEYAGHPVEARRPPWDGGLIWKTDSSGNPWITVTCQGDGASLWWPNKDHQSDEPDSMLINVTVPPGLEDVSNGRLRARTVLPDGWTRFEWSVASPINNYNVTLNIGRYAHFRDIYVTEDTLTLDYYVLPQNLEQAKEHFRQVKSMLTCFERLFGKYPFPKDGYKLIECPHTGMEHQSAVGYGNWYLNGYRGRSWSDEGLSFDFIIIHESAHEWWGNSVTAKDIADMWIHESFGAYAEALYLECTLGRSASLRYINAKKPNVGNRSPIIGPPNVNHAGDSDMYDKGQLVLNTLRSVLGNDSLWFSIVRGLAETFRWQTVTSGDVVAYISRRAGMDLQPFFEQYLNHPKIPTLQVDLVRRGLQTTARFRWIADVKEFTMPVRVTISPDRYEVITPTTSWQTKELGDLDPQEFKVAEELSYINVKLNWSYTDPRTPDRRNGMVLPEE